jgi:hypothetical protein
MKYFAQQLGRGGGEKGEKEDVKKNDRKGVRKNRWKTERRKEMRSRKQEKVTRLEMFTLVYTDIPKVFFTPHQGR